MSATTTPPGLLVDVTYEGSANPPTNAGSYTVIGNLNDPCYQLSETNTLVINPAASMLSSATLLTNGTFQFSFTNSPGASFSVLTTTNVALPLSNWSVGGAVTEVAPGLYSSLTGKQRTAGNASYRVRSF